MKTIVISNQKGGVAKTTTAVNLAASLGVFGKRTLLVDLDPQGNATMGCGVEKTELEQSMVEVCLKELNIDQIIRKTAFAHLSVAPSNQDLTVAEVEMRSLEQAPFILREQLAQLAKDNAFDYVVIDCPPALNILTVNAMAAADYVAVPIQCEYYALEGLAALLDTVNDIQKSVNAKLEIVGFLRTMYDGRAKLTLEVSQQLELYLKDKVFETIIPRNIRLAEAPSYGKPVNYYDRSSRGARAYRKFAKELLQRLENN